MLIDDILTNYLIIIADTLTNTLTICTFRDVGVVLRGPVTGLRRPVKWERSNVVTGPVSDVDQTISELNPENLSALTSTNCVLLTVTGIPPTAGDHRNEEIFPCVSVRLCLI